MKSENLENRKALEPRQTLQTSVDEALQRVISFHETVREFYDEWARVTQDEKARLLLEHLVQLEDRRSENLREYQAQAPKEIVSTWLKVGPEIETENWLSEIEMNPRISAHDVSEVAGKLLDLLLKVLETQAKQSESVEVREFLQKLHDDERRAKLYALRSTELH